MENIQEPVSSKPESRVEVFIKPEPHDEPDYNATPNPVVGAQHELNMEQYVYNETLLPYCFESSLKEEPSKQVLLSTDKSVTEKNMTFQDGDPQTKNVSPGTEIIGQDNTIHEHYQCHHCGNTFRKRKVLTSHIRMSCKNVPKTVKCDRCSSYFKSTDALKKHAVIHNEHKPFHCDVCEKSFFKLRYFRNHILQHNIDRQFICEICGKGFTTRHYLKSHGISHTLIKRYKCEQCGRGFSRKNHYNAHKRIHSDERPHKCEQCGKCFKFHYHLNTHKVIHSELRPFKCQNCGKSFKIKRILDKHIQIHNGVRFKCEMCGQSYSRKNYLSKHAKSHSK